MKYIKTLCVCQSVYQMSATNDYLEWINNCSNHHMLSGKSPYPTILNVSQYGFPEITAIRVQLELLSK